MHILSSLVITLPTMMKTMINQVFNTQILCRNARTLCLPCLQTSAGGFFHNIGRRKNRNTEQGKIHFRVCVQFDLVGEYALMHILKPNVNTEHKQRIQRIYVAYTFVYVLTVYANTRTPYTLHCCMGNEVSCIWQGNLVRGAAIPLRDTPRHPTPTHLQPTPTLSATSSLTFILSSPTPWVNVDTYISLYL